MSPQVTPITSHDVTIIGGGLAGKAASLHLSRAGFSVVCIQPETPSRPAVGESLDWSAPELLRVLGLPMELLVREEIATWKRHVTVKMPDGGGEDYIPSPWLSGFPFHVELRTLHVDRVRLDDELQKMIARENIHLVQDKVTQIEKQDRRILSVRTEGGLEFSSRWYIDASGFGAPVLAREFDLPAIQYGPPKVAAWTYFNVSEQVEGTTLYMDPGHGQYLGWTWEIPIRPRIVSVGFVLSGAAVRTKRDGGLSVEEVFRQQLENFPRFKPLLDGGVRSPLNITSFRCRVHLGVAGPNWMMAGEAASMVDPMTSNGVTAALRHASEASDLIIKYRNRGRLPQRAQNLYSKRILQMAKFFNDGIEKIVYEPPVRERVGLPKAGMLYTSPAWSMNVVYARLKPKGTLATFILTSMLAFFRASADLLYRFCNRPRALAQRPS